MITVYIVHILKKVDMITVYIVYTYSTCKQMISVYIVYIVNM